MRPIYQLDRGLAKYGGLTVLDVASLRTIPARLGVSCGDGVGMAFDGRCRTTIVVCFTAGAKNDADECWRRACLLLASYGGHKDPTISEIIDSVDDIASVGVDTARACLEKLVDLAYLVRQHTDGRDTSHFVNRWWEKAAVIDPIAAGLDGADTLLAELGFEDVRAYTAHTHLLETQVRTADPIALAALRLTVGTGWRRPDIDTQLLTRLQDERGKNPQTEVMLAILANNVAATYDDQPMLYADGQPKSVVFPELVNTVARLGGAALPARTPRPEQKRNSAWDSNPEPDPLELQRQLVNGQRPVVPEGRAGVALAAREFANQRYRNDPAPMWDLDAVTNAIGWRVVEATFAYGAEASIALIDDVAREVPRFSDNEVFAGLGEGLAARCEGASDSLRTVASYCLTLAYIRIRGGGGWRTFAGRERVHLWTTAHELESVTAERTLAGGGRQHGRFRCAAHIRSDAGRSRSVRLDADRCAGWYGGRVLGGCVPGHPTSAPGNRRT